MILTKHRLAPVESVSIRDDDDHGVVEFIYTDELRRIVNVNVASNGGPQYTGFSIALRKHEISRLISALQEMIRS